MNVLPKGLRARDYISTRDRFPDEGQLRIVVQVELAISYFDAELFQYGPGIRKINCVRVLPVQIHEYWLIE
jgi:hypothetical protein